MREPALLSAGESLAHELRGAWGDEIFEVLEGAEKQSTGYLDALDLIDAGLLETMNPSSDSETASQQPVELDAVLFKSDDGDDGVEMAQ